MKIVLFSLLQELKKIFPQITDILKEKTSGKYLMILVKDGNEKEKWVKLEKFFGYSDAELNKSKSKSKSWFEVFEDELLTEFSSEK